MNRKSKPGKAHADVKVQPPLLALIHIALAFVLTWLVPLPLSVPLFLQSFGFFLMVVGFLLGVAALLAFRQARARSTVRDSGTHLVTQGIYRFTRNPVYLGFLFILIGFSLSTGSYWGILLSPLLVFLLNRLVILPEEEYLRRNFGEDFIKYSARVRRWI